MKIYKIDVEAFEHLELYPLEYQQIHMLKKIMGLVMFCMLTMQAIAQLSPCEKEFLHAIIAKGVIPEQITHSFDALPSERCHNDIVVSRGGASNILFKHYPVLQEKLSYVSLGSLPTPLIHCKQLPAQFSQVNIFVKHDGLTGFECEGKKLFGGNKLRKLQYLLADALAQDYQSVMTFGCVGSNHALQTTVCAQHIGLQSICILRPQPNSHVARRNLLLQQAHGAQLLFAPDRLSAAFASVAVCYDHKQRYGKFPYIIPVGGSNARGAIGYVEAAFELKEQIDAGLISVPDRIYVTLGSGGTAAGLLLGIKAAQITTKLYLVTDEPEDIAGEAIDKVKNLAAETNVLLQSYDTTFPTCTITENDYCVIADCAGSQYGLFTKEGVAAMNLMRTAEDIQLDGTYTGKCFSALVRDVQSGSCNGQTVLFWNTFCGEPLRNVTDSVDYRHLPKAFHRYFEEDVQPLDQVCD